MSVTCIDLSKVVLAIDCAQVASSPRATRSKRRTIEGSEGGERSIRIFAVLTREERGKEQRGKKETAFNLSTVRVRVSALVGHVTRVGWGGGGGCVCFCMNTTSVRLLKDYVLMDNLAGVYTFNRVYQNTQWHIPVQNFRILN